MNAPLEAPAWEAIAARLRPYIDARGKVIAYEPRPLEDLPADCCK